MHPSTRTFISTSFCLVCLAFFATATAQTYQWSKRAGGNGYDGPAGLTIEPNGEFYLSGYAESTPFDNQPMHSHGCSDAFLVKYSSNQSAAWVRSFGSIICDYAGSHCRDEAGNLYMLTYMSYDAYYDSTPITTTGDRTIVIARFSPQGHLDWTKIFSGNQTDMGMPIKYHNGHLYVAGDFVGMLNTDGMSWQSQGTARNGFVMQLDTTGQVQWFRYGFSFGNFDINHLAVDNAGYSYVTGNFQGTAYFGAIVMQPSVARPGFIAKLDPYGYVLWVKQYHSIYSPEHVRIAVSNSGDIYLASHDLSFYMDTWSVIGDNMMWLARCDSLCNVKWVRRAKSPSEIRPYDMVFDSNENVYLWGDYRDTVLFGPITLPPPPNTYAGFLAHFSDNGTLVDAFGPKLGQNSSTFNRQVVLQGDTALYLSAQFSGTIYFGTDSLLGRGVWDMYVAKYLVSSIVSSPNPIEPTPLRIFPNPAGSSVTIDDPRIRPGDRLDIMQLNGVVILSQELTKHTTTLHLQDLPRGIYIYVLKPSRGPAITGKLVLQ